MGGTQVLIFLPSTVISLEVNLMNTSRSWSTSNTGKSHCFPFWTILHCALGGVWREEERQKIMISDNFYFIINSHKKYFKFSSYLIFVYRKSKIYQHLVGFQIFKMEERPNYPPINTQSKDTGRFYVSISHTFRLFNNSAMYVSKLKEEDPENAPFKSFFHTFQFSPFSDTMPKELVAFVDYLPTL